VTDPFQEPIDATALTPTERDGLLQTWITTRAELNIAERENIVNGEIWARRRRASETADLLNEEYAKALHKQMFGEVWSWAGTYRQGESNIGDNVEPHRIQPDVWALFDNVRYWLEHQSYARDEIAVQLHHRLVAIHPFPNGNGRHSRLMADLLIEKLGGERFSWAEGLGDAGPLRKRYIAALKTADDHDIGPLLAFARS
jgi:Fic-DOC domain mobile mystery protein B